MTTNYHTPLSTTERLPATGGTINAPLGELDEAIGESSTAIGLVQEDVAAIDTRVEEIEDALGGLGQMFGRLSLVSGDPYGAGSVTASRIHYTPYMGNTVRVYNPALSKFVLYSFSALDFYLDDLHTQLGIYDLFVFQSGGQVFLGANYQPWSSAAARGERYEVELKDGLYVNSSGLTVIYTTALGGTTNDSVLIEENAGTYVGSFRLNNAYEVSMTDNEANLYNAYNRLPYRMALLSENEHSYSTATHRNWNNTDETKIALLFGLLQDEIFQVTVISIAEKYAEVGVDSGNNALYQGGTYVDPAQLQVFGRYFNIEALGMTNVIGREKGAADALFESIEIEVVSWR